MITVFMLSKLKTNRCGVFNSTQSQLLSYSHQDFLPTATSTRTVLLKLNALQKVLKKTPEANQLIYNFVAFVRKRNQKKP